MSIIKRFGEVYSEGDVKVDISGLQDVDITMIEYGYKYEHKKAERVRRKTGAWMMGKREDSGKIGLPLDVINAFEKVAPNHDLAMIKPFPIVVTFTSDENEIITDVVIAKFQGNDRKVSSGGGEITNEFELFVLDIKLNVGA